MATGPTTIFTIIVVTRDSVYILKRPTCHIFLPVKEVNVGYTKKLNYNYKIKMRHKHTTNIHSYNTDLLSVDIDDINGI